MRSAKRTSLEICSSHAEILIDTPINGGNWETAATEKLRVPTDNGYRLTTGPTDNGTD